MSTFPGGWTYTTYVFNDPAEITVPACPGVIHVLDSFSAKIVNGATGTAVLTTINLSSSDGTYTGLQIGLLYADEASAGPPTTAGSDSASGSGLNLMAGPGASLTISFPTGTTDQYAILIIQGHDI